ncbi:hypothetical protein PP7435_CHR2-0783 [Komagataella phaffii CBS 7435]|uniref:Cytochrome b5 heme-binding domain-containing protein n=2 Tax=Komagataella phaffii TaxID=460519 RepID=C4R0W8_KOMPG|nr:Hypothetical protein PAS_chr2-1_0510 [Komagataella phaffii GS115]AOA62122.1 GQ67_00558T0 [Komagataella phaffii]CAH2448336.1 hypothetical protein BQ9382_C2-4220 [Komagataella phaffii CBS 7435]AOA67680.1 GQ68_00830T0 [Komagataella phaffii GS115]CAY69142.1 Hypothetical protein PAS_chr2-1_0510 [Komagataella phaffii GS115]SCV12059.1 hypothetical protein PP7435_CHR2-0783 [Komagataella phaffii CBS 7435]
MRTRLNLIDLLRVAGGVLLLNCIFSFVFTSSPTWNYSGKYVDPRYYKHLITPNIVLTDAQLAVFNGNKQHLPVYVAVNGTIFDVTKNRHLYSKGSSYHRFAGRDGSRALGTGCLTNPNEYTWDLRGLTERQLGDIASWHEYYRNHRDYWVAGSVVHNYSELPKQAPEPCINGMKFPKNIH